MVFKEILISIIWMAVVVSSATFNLYVGPSGNDTNNNNCSDISFECRTISHALNELDYYSPSSDFITITVLGDLDVKKELKTSFSGNVTIVSDPPNNKLVLQEGAYIFFDDNGEKILKNLDIQDESDLKNKYKFIHIKNGKIDGGSLSLKGLNNSGIQVPSVIGNCNIKLSEDFVGVLDVTLFEDVSITSFSNMEESLFVQNVMYFMHVDFINVPLIFNKKENQVTFTKCVFGGTITLESGNFEIIAGLAKKPLVLKGHSTTQVSQEFQFGPSLSGKDHNLIIVDEESIAKFTDSSFGPCDSKIFFSISGGSELHIISSSISANNIDQSIFDVGENSTLVLDSTELFSSSAERVFDIRYSKVITVTNSKLEGMDSYKEFLRCVSSKSSNRELDIDVVKSNITPYINDIECNDCLVNGDDCSDFYNKYKKKKDRNNWIVWGIPLIVVSTICLCCLVSLYFFGIILLFFAVVASLVMNYGTGTSKKDGTFSYEHLVD